MAASNALARIIAISRGLIEKLDNELGTETRDPPLLFHYTRPDALLKILETGTLRATDVAYMNDSGELTYGRNLVSEVATRLEKDCSTAEERSLLGCVRDWMPRYTARVYAACLTTRGDQLSQWCRYANDGAGYSIGFQFARSAELPLAVGGGPGGTLTEVLYDRKKQEAQIEEVLTAFCAIAGADPRLEAEFACHVLHYFTAVFKDDAFVEEHEWRIVVTSGAGKTLEESAEVAPSRFGLSPFVSVQYGKPESLSQIGMGPRFDANLAKAAAMVALRRSGYDDKPVELWHAKATYK